MNLLLVTASQVSRDREAQYGPTKLCLERIAARWSQVLAIPVTPAQVCLCMIDVKMARLAEVPNHPDSAVDIAGYAAMLSEAQG